jgi:hypothetical protein
MIDDKCRIQGEKAWQEARVILKSGGWHLQQIDWLGERNGSYIKFEIKGQEAFTPPPFKGHGLPYWQVRESMQLLKDKDIRTYLMIKDTGENKWYGNFLDELEKGEHIDTHGQNPRRIYNIDNFHNIDLTGMPAQ